MTDILRLGDFRLKPGSLKAADVRPVLRSASFVEAGSGSSSWAAKIALWGRGWWATYIVAQHDCSPPEDARAWFEVASLRSNDESSDGHGRYVCPECGQHFATAESMNVNVGTTN